MLVEKSQWPVVITLFLGIFGFGTFFILKQNYEFLVYVGVIVFFALLVLATNAKVRYPNHVLWLLAIWAFLHMGGGGLFIGGERLYGLMLVPITEQIFRFDQAVHMFGFFTATLIAFHLLTPTLKKPIKTPVALSIVVVMAGLGMGALNEIVEFLVTVVVPETGVGGYVNTSLDLIANLIGAVCALFVIWKKK